MCDLTHSSTRCASRDYLARAVGTSLFRGSAGRQAQYALSLRARKSSDAESFASCVDSESSVRSMMSCVSASDMLGSSEIETFGESGQRLRTHTSCQDTRMFFMSTLCSLSQPQPQPGSLALLAVIAGVAQDGITTLRRLLRTVVVDSDVCTVPSARGSFWTGCIFLTVGLLSLPPWSTSTRVALWMHASSSFEA